MKKLSSFSSVVWSSYTEFQSSLQYKLVNEISRYFNVVFYVYVDASSDVESFATEKNCVVCKIKYYKRNKFMRLFSLFNIICRNISIINKEKSDLVWFYLSAGALLNNFLFVYKIFCCNQKFFLQTTTPSVAKSKIKRNIQDFLLSINLKFFKHIGVDGEDSVNVAKFKLKHGQLCIVQVGMTDYGCKNRIFKSLDLVYIGTLNSRNVWQAIDGFAIFAKKNEDISCSFHIIGGGTSSEKNKIKESINQSGCSEKIIYHGQLSNIEVAFVFEECNVGVAYVPIVDYFQNNSTKTVEYALCGMPIIATANSVRSRMITSEIGVLCKDNSSSFAEALELMWKNLKGNQYSSAEIRSQFEKYSMSSAIQNTYVSTLDKIISYNS